MGELFEVEKQERLKILFLSLAFFLIIAGYTLVKDLKDSIFMTVVGREYVPLAKLFALIFLTPGILLYSYLVDRWRRYQVLCFYSALFGSLGLLLAFFIGHETIGIANAQPSPWRLFGWFFYLFGEGYTPFVISVFWAFANSVNSPESAKKGYSLMVAASKFGGAITAGLAWIVFSWHENLTANAISDTALHQIAILISAVTLLLIPVIIHYLMKMVPGENLHGYEAAYQFEKHAQKEQREKDAKLPFFKRMKSSLAGIFSGLSMLFRYPYAMGIFGLVFFYEVVAAVLNYTRLKLALSSADSISGVSAFLFKTYFITHVIGVIISLFGTRALLNRLGERVCLLLVPVLSGVLILYFMIDMSSTSFVAAFVVLKAVNYAFAWPVRESLYIPTVKDIKFKTKSWIDAFGSKLAKTAGQGFNSMANYFGPEYFLSVHSFFFSFVMGLWFLTAYALGNRFDRAVSRNEVIGSELEKELR